MCMRLWCRAANKPSKQTIMYLWTTRQTLRLGDHCAPLMANCRHPWCSNRQTNSRYIETTRVFKRSNFDPAKHFFRAFLKRNYVCYIVCVRRERGQNLKVTISLEFTLGTVCWLEWLDRDRIQSRCHGRAALVLCPSPPHLQKGTVLTQNDERIEMKTVFTSLKKRSCSQIMWKQFIV